jgi:hypothetical protein
VILWSWIRKKVEVILAQIERLKSLVLIALKMYHLLVLFSDIGGIFSHILTVRFLARLEKAPMQFSNITTTTSTMKFWNESLQPISQRSTTI